MYNILRLIKPFYAQFKLRSVPSFLPFLPQLSFSAPFIDWIWLSFFAFLFSIFYRLRSDICLLNVIDFVALTLVQPSVTITNRHSNNNRNNNNTNTPTTWATVKFRFHIAPNLLLFLAIIELTLCSWTLLRHRGGEGGRGKEQSRYASKDVATRRDDCSDSAANKGAACPVEMPMTWPFSMALGASASASARVRVGVRVRGRVCVRLMSCVWPTRQGNQEGRQAAHSTDSWTRVCAVARVHSFQNYFLSKLELEDHTRRAAAPCGAAFNNSMANTFLSACPKMTLTKCSSWERVQEQCQVQAETETELETELELRQRLKV